VIVQLDRTPTAEEREELERSGIRLVEYLQNQAWYASVAGGLAEFSPVLERVRGSWSIEPADRLAPRLR